MGFPRYRNIDRYVITRIIGDYQKNKSSLQEKNKILKNDNNKDFYLMYEFSRRKRLQEECDAVEFAMDLARSKTDSQKYFDLLYLLYWRSPRLFSKSEACRRLCIEEKQANEFLKNFRGLVALKTGRMEVL